MVFVQHDAFISSASSDRRDDASTAYAAEVQFIAASDITGMAPAAAGSQSTCSLLHCGASWQASGLRLLQYSTILFLLHITQWLHRDGCQLFTSLLCSCQQRPARPSSCSTLYRRAVLSGFSK